MLDFVQTLLQFRPNERPSAERALSTMTESQRCKTGCSFWKRDHRNPTKGNFWKNIEIQKCWSERRSVETTSHPGCNRHHQDYSIFSGESLYIDLYLWLLLGWGIDRRDMLVNRRVQLHSVPWDLYFQKDRMSWVRCISLGTWNRFQEREWMEFALYCPLGLKSLLSALILGLVFME